METTTLPAQNEDLKKLGDLIKDIKVAMLVTSEADGTLRGRPMMSEQMTFDGTLWFFSKVDSPKGADIRRRHSVQLSYADPDTNRYVSISGYGDVITDKVKIAELWKPSMKAWFPKGLEDPEVSLIRVTIAQAEYWDGPSATAITLMKLVNTLKGNPDAAPAGDHKKVNLTV